jgi:hypothetical protein
LGKFRYRSSLQLPNGGTFAVEPSTRTHDERGHDTMKTLLGTLALGALLALSSVAIAADAPESVVGSWKLNTAKSTGNIPMPKSETRTYAAAPDGVALTWTRVGADGKESTVKTTFKYDGKDYPVTGSPDFDALNAKRVDANTIESVQKRNGKDVGTTKRAVSADGKTLTLTSKFTTADGKDAMTMMVYDRQ